MTAPDRPVQDVIAEVVMRHRPDLDGFCICDDPVNVRCTGAHIAAAVVAACREATVAQQAELLGGRVGQTLPCCRCNLPGAPDGEHGVILANRVLGPWREDPS